MTIDTIKATDSNKATDTTKVTDTIKLTGRIKWLNEAKGIGLITPDRGGKDVFASVPVRRSADKPGGLKIKQHVSYDVKAGPDGEQAFNVKLIAA